MREAIRMWRETRMVVLVGISAAAYVAVLLPFKLFPIIPGFTEARPAAAIPVLLSFLFGPAGAWGAAIGNLVGDLLGGMFGPGSVPGFVANFLYGFLPYALWRALFGTRPPLPRTAGQWAGFVLVMVTASAACGLIVGWGVGLLGLAPFLALANIILVNNAAFCVTLVSALIFLLYPRIERWGLLYTEILGDQVQTAATPRRRVGAVLAVIGALGGIAAANGALLAGFGAHAIPIAAPLVGLTLVAAFLL